MVDSVDDFLAHYGVKGMRCGLVDKGADFVKNAFGR